MEIKKFVHEEDLPSKERAILILLDVVREKIKKSKGRESQFLFDVRRKFSGRYQQDAVIKTRTENKGKIQ